MPWPMVHFAIAARVASFNPSPSFLLGSIAPDAIHMRENVTRKNKGFTHLISDEDTFPSMETLKKHCLAYLSQNTEDTWKEYILGYFAHIYTDIRWTETIYLDFEEKFQGDRNGIRKTYNQEVSQVEFNLLRSEEWVPNVLNQLQSSRAYSIDPFVTQLEVNQYKDTKLTWLQDDDNEPKIVPEYFTNNIVREFILLTAEELKVLYSEWKIS